MIVYVLIMSFRALVKSFSAWRDRYLAQPSAEIDRYVAGGLLRIIDRMPSGTLHLRLTSFGESTLAAQDAA